MTIESCLPNSSPSIAGVVLTLNEENCVPLALQSLSWCDEIVVVDSGSTDNTRLVVAEHGARFIQRIPSKPFRITEQRNWVLSHADIKSEWVFFLDADEQAGHSLAHHILETISSSATFDAYELTPRYWFLGRWLKHTQGYPNWHPRLIRRGATCFVGGVWESFAPDARIGRITVPYEHYAFSKGFDDWLERHRRYSSWDAEQIVAFLITRKSATLTTSRSRSMRLLLSQFWWIRPPLRFLQKYILQAGFLEGWQGLLFVLMMAGYDMMTVIKVIELLRRQKNLPL